MMELYAGTVVEQVLLFKEVHSVGAEEAPPRHH